MDRLELVIAVSDVLLNVYGRGTTRVKKLTAKYGEDADTIQKEVNTVCSQQTQAHYMAVACIAGHYGVAKARRKALRTWYTKVQDRIDYIYDMRGKTVTSAAKLVISGMFDKDDVRELLLKFCGYDPEEVQAEVNRILAEKSTARFCVYPIYFFEEDEGLFGDCTAVLEYDADGNVVHCILIDTAQASASNVVIRKLKALGVTHLTLVISHAHGDHYGGFYNLKKAFTIDRLYLPDCTELDKYQKSYGNAMRSLAKKVSNHVYLTKGRSFTQGNIRCECVYQCPANKLSEHDGHHFVNNQSTVLRFDLGGIIYHTAGDLQNEGNNLLIKAVPNLKCNIYKCQWHGDANACNEAIAKATRPDHSTSDYHRSPSRSGRGTTRKRLQAVGSKFWDNYTYGDIWFYIKEGKVTVKHSK